MKTNETELLMKTGMCNTLGSLRRLVVVWEQFHDCFLLKLPVKYYPEKVSKKKPSVGYDWIFHYWGTPYTCMGCFSEAFWEENLFWILFLRNKYLVIWVLPLLLQSEEDLLGSSSWKLLELTSVSRFLAYVTHPHEWRISVLAEKNLLWGKKNYPVYTRVSW